MTRDEMISKLKEQQYFYGFMYVSGHVADGDIIKINIDRAVTITPNIIYFIWGMPGPDYNTYYFSDYGKTWAFTKEELPKYGVMNLMGEVF